MEISLLQETRAAKATAAITKYFFIGRCILPFKIRDITDILGFTCRTLAEKVLEDFLRNFTLRSGIRSLVKKNSYHDDLMSLMLFDTCKYNVFFVCLCIK